MATRSATRRSPTRHRSPSHRRRHPVSSTRSSIRSRQCCVRPALTADLQAVASRILDAGLTPVKTFRSYKDVDHVVRYAVDGTTQTVIAKLGGKWGEGRWDLHNEWASLEFLDGSFAPRLLGSDGDAGVIVFEDLGDRVTVADRLLGDDATTAGDAISRSPNSSARCMRVRSDAGPSFSRSGSRCRRAALRPDDLLSQRHLIDDFRAVTTKLNVVLPDDVVSVCERALAEDDISALTHGDTCPDNVLLTEDGARFIDFELAGFRHPMLDGVYARVPFATCWCVNRLPPESSPRSSRRTGERSAIRRGSIERRRTGGCSGCCTRRCGGSRLEEADETWGISTRRQRLAMRWGDFADRADVNVLAAFGGRVRDAVAERWPETEPMPLYPAFRSPRVWRRGSSVQMPSLSAADSPGCGRRSDLPPEWDVLVIDKGTGPDLGSSPWAQGGMAVAVGPTTRRSCTRTTHCAPAPAHAPRER